MKVVLKSGDSIDCDPVTFSPEEKDEFGITLNLSIGLSNSDGADYFDVLVCTPKWLSKNFWVPALVRHMLIVRKYDLNEIQDVINKCIEKCTCKTWDETSLMLSRYFASEFEDYQP